MFGIIKEVQGKHYLSLATNIVDGVQTTNFIECDKKGNIKDAIEEYYRLKQGYDGKFNQEKRTILNNDRLNKKSMRAAFGVMISASHMWRVRPE